jgi:NitT/TauT family transport system permease protein
MKFRALRMVSPIVLLILWEVASRIGLVNPQFLPPFSKAMLDLVHLAGTGELFSALAASLFRVVSGFVIAVVIGVTLGALMGRYRWMDDLADPLVELLRPISPLALFPLAILWFGLGDASKIFIIALAASFPVIQNTYAGVRSIEQNFFRASGSFGATQSEMFFNVVLPGCLPQMFTGIRLAWGVSLIVIIAAEMVGATTGIGYMVLEAQQTFRTERVFAGIIVVGLVGFVTDLGFRHLRNIVIPWYQENEN